MVDGKPSVKDVIHDVYELKADMAHIDTLVDRLDLTINKLTEVSQNISELLAIQGIRLEQQEKTTMQMLDLLEKRRIETEQNIHHLRQQISNVETNLNNIIEKKVSTEVHDLAIEAKRQQDKLQEKITFLEKWIWVVTGGAAIVSFILSKLVLGFKIN